MLPWSVSIRCVCLSLPPSSSYTSQIVSPVPSFLFWEKIEYLHSRRPFTTHTWKKRIWFLIDFSYVPRKINLYHILLYSSSKTAIQCITSKWILLLTVTACKWRAFFQLCPIFLCTFVWACCLSKHTHTHTQWRCTCKIHEHLQAARKDYDFLNQSAGPLSLLQCCFYWFYCTEESKAMSQFDFWWPCCATVDNCRRSNSKHVTGSGKRTHFPPFNGHKQATSCFQLTNTVNIRKSDFTN